jgi:hypothetical protein
MHQHMSDKHTTNITQSRTEVQYSVLHAPCACNAHTHGLNMEDTVLYVPIVGRQCCDDVAHSCIVVVYCCNSRYRGDILLPWRYIAGHLLCMVATIDVLWWCIIDLIMYVSGMLLQCGPADVLCVVLLPCAFCCLGHWSCTVVLWSFSGTYIMVWHTIQCYMFSGSHGHVVCCFLSGDVFLTAGMYYCHSHVLWWGWVLNCYGHELRWCTVARFMYCGGMLFLCLFYCQYQVHLTLFMIVGLGYLGFGCGCER